MRRLILISVLALVAGTGLWHLVQQDPGYILIVVAGKTIEMRFAFAVVLVLAAILLWVGVRRLIRGAMGVRNGWGFAANRRVRLTEQRTRRGLLHYMEGDWRAARQDLMKAARRLPDPLLHYVVAADSAQHMGQFQQARDLLVQAEQGTQRRPLTVAVNLARLQLAEGQYQECLATLHRARTQAPTNVTVLALLRRAYAAVADWASLELLLADLHQHKVLSQAEFDQLDQQVYTHLLNQAGKSPSGDGQAVDFKALEEIWMRMPKALHQRPALVEIYVRWLLLAGRHDQAENLLRHTLKQQWSETLADLYGLTFADNRQGQLHTAQRWLEQHAEDPALHLTLGRLYLRNELWGQAKDHLQQSLKLRPSPAAYAELARLLTNLGEHKASVDTYHAGLMLTTHGLPNLPQPTPR